MKYSEGVLLRHAGIIVIVLFLVAAAYLWYGRFVELNMLKQKCDEIEKSPDLLYPCDCFPTPEKNENPEGYVENRTEAFCTCVCDIGNNQTYAIEVRIAR